MDKEAKRRRVRLNMIFDRRWDEPPEWALSLVAGDVPTLMTDLAATPSPEPYMGLTPLMLAVHQGRGPAVRALIRAGHPIEVDPSSAHQPLTLALQRIDLGQGGAAKALLEAGATVHWEDMASALLWSTAGDRAQALLAKHGVDWENPDRLRDVLNVVTTYPFTLNDNGLWRFRPEDLERFVAARTFPASVWEELFVHLYQRVSWHHNTSVESSTEMPYLLVLAHRWRQASGEEWNNRTLYGAVGDFWSRRHHEANGSRRAGGVEHRRDAAWMKQSIQALQESMGPWASPAPGEPDAFVSLLDRVPAFGALFLGSDFMHLALDSPERCVAAYRALCASLSQGAAQQGAWSRLAVSASWETMEAVAVDTVFPLSVPESMAMVERWVRLGWRSHDSQWNPATERAVMSACLAGNPVEVPSSLVETLAGAGVSVQAMFEGLWGLPSFRASSTPAMGWVPQWAGALAISLLERGAVVTAEQKILLQQWSEEPNGRQTFAKGLLLHLQWKRADLAPDRPRF